jgi:hypothetical protein
MHFPTWVDKPKNVKQRACNRLKYLIGRITLDMAGNYTHRDLADQAGFDRTSMYSAFRSGCFSKNVATRIESVVGRKHTPKEWLIDPLNIPTENS